MYCKEDCSFQGGYEMVTHPHTLLKLREDKNNWKRLFDHIDGSNYVDYSTGMHIHMSRQAFTSYQLFRFCAFFNRRPNSDFIFKLSGRPEKTGYAERIYNKKDFIDAAKGRQIGERESYTNTTNHSTIEVRVFGAVDNYDSMMKNIELCDAVFYYTKTAKVLSRFEFCEWLGRQSGYKLLKQEIERIYGKDIFPRHALRKVA
jgi:hypothetical protein